MVRCCLLASPAPPAPLPATTAASSCCLLQLPQLPLLQDTSQLSQKRGNHPTMSTRLDRIVAVDVVVAVAVVVALVVAVRVWCLVLAMTEFLFVLVSVLVLLFSHTINKVIE